MRQADSHESLEFPIRENHPIRANRANFRFARITPLRWKRYDQELQRQRTCQTFGVNFLVRFASKSFFYWEDLFTHRSAGRGLFRRGLFVVHTRNDENYGNHENHETKIWKLLPEPRKPRDEVLKATPFGAPNKEFICALMPTFGHFKTYGSVNLWFACGSPLTKTTETTKITRTTKTTQTATNKEPSAGFAEITETTKMTKTTGIQGANHRFPKPQVLEIPDKSHNLDGPNWGLFLYQRVPH